MLFDILITKYFHRRIKNLYMDPEPINLFSEGPLPQVTDCYGQWEVIRSCTTTSKLILELHQNGFTQISYEGAIIQSVAFDFDLKFSFSLNPPELIFERANETCIYKFKSLTDIENWRQVLKKKLNQRGFHEQFKAISKIGKGNFATVYLVKKRQTGHQYAVKAFSKESAYSEENGKECLIKQIQVMRQLNHPNCMKLEEVFQTENSLYIVFQLLQGGQLCDKVQNKYKFKPYEAKQIVFGILKGLREMHSKNIMHRDLKPENLLFRSEDDYDCVIADFGLAQFSDAEQYLFVRCGTPGYVAPEVINIKDLKTKYHPICDVFSLGLIFYLLLLGKSPFPGKTYDDVLAQNRASNIHLKEEDKQKINNPNAVCLLLKMLTKNPKQRITTEEALNHPYFSEMKSQMTNESTEKCFKQVNINDNESIKVDSPLLTTANKERKLNKKIKKDSCVDFKMGKENVLTGKPEAIGPLNSSNKKNSFVNATQSPAHKVKYSKFKQN